MRDTNAHGRRSAWNIPDPGQSRRHASRAAANQKNYRRTRPAVASVLVGSMEQLVGCNDHDHYRAFDPRPVPPAPRAGAGAGVRLGWDDPRQTVAQYRPRRAEAAPRAIAAEMDRR